MCSCMGMCACVCVCTRSHMHMCAYLVSVSVFNVCVSACMHACMCYIAMYLTGSKASNHYKNSLAYVILESLIMLSRSQQWITMTHTC